MPDSGRTVKKVAADTPVLSGLGGPPVPSADAYLLYCWAPLRGMVHDWVLEVSRHGSEDTEG